MTLTEILENFELLDDWEDRYRYIIELGRALDEFPEQARTSENKVRGCASQVWIVTTIEDAAATPDPKLTFIGDSDAHIVSGLIAILLTVYSGQTATEILKTDPQAIFQKLGLAEHLTQQRSNGLASMVQRIQRDAKAALTKSS